MGIIGFVSVAQTSGGVSQPSAAAWWSAGLGFAFQAAVTKVFVTVIGDGLGPILSSWTTYALIALAAAITGVVVLAAAQPERG